MDLVWRPTVDASCFHAASALVDGRSLINAELTAAIESTVEDLDAALSNDAIDRNVFFDHLVPQSTAAASSTELARLTLMKTVGHDRAESMTVQYADLLRNLRRAYTTARPSLADELPGRGAPLEQQWNARGPGLINQIGRLTDEVLLVERAEVLLVEPVLGGGGAAHMLYNSVRIEAVLANPEDRLPESLRLAWLLALLNFDLPMLSERLHRDRLRIVGPLSMLPVVLTAGEYVEVAACDAASIDAAIAAWRCKLPDATRVADTLLTWWETYQSRRPSWSIALAALDEML
ncbi:MAG: hypothetical protein MI757_21840 [Pirellulales bacterium]|nr:hypothetical protein [Pirellulales bacterium]